MKPEFFQTPADFGTWLEKNHATATELWVGFYKKDSGKPSITWPESVDQALCFGWIDGIRKRVDEISYQIRFTPRRRGSIWSAINIKRAKELVRQKQMRPTGLKAFAARIENKSGIYSYEQRSTELERTIRKVAEEEQSSLELFRKTAAVVSKNDRLVDYQREERRNANGSPGKINQRVCERKTPASIAISLPLTSSGSALLNREADVAPPAPFVMRSALHIAAASLFFVRVRFGDEFRERSVHLDIV